MRPNRGNATKYTNSAILLAVAASVGTMFANGTKIGDLYYNLNAANQTAEVTYEWANEKNYNGLITANIPASVTYSGTTYSVTSIGDYAFYNCSGLTSVTIPNSVTSIGKEAFYKCSSLTSLSVEAGNTVYDSRNNCNAIIETSTNTLIVGCQNTTIPNSITSIGDYAFSYCSSLTSVTIPNSVTSIGNSAFSNCSSLTSINVADDNPNYSSKDGVLFNKQQTTLIQCPGGMQGEYVIPNSVTSIASNAFQNCSSLTSVTIPNSVTSIGDYAFNGVNNIIYSGTATGSPWGAKCVNGYVDGYLVYSDDTKTTLLGCSAAATGDIVIPNSVTSIGSYAFYGCSGLTSATIPNSVTSIGYAAFYKCSSLTSVTLNSNAIVSQKYSKINVSGFFIWSNIGSLFDSQVKEYIIGESVTSIGEYAFGDCSSLTSVTIPNSVTSIGGDAFYGCRIASINFTGTIEEWCNKSWSPTQISSEYQLSINGEPQENVIIPNSVTNIGGNAFNGCSMKNILFGTSVKVIEARAFADCNSIETITCYSMRPPTATIASAYFDDGSFPKSMPYSTIIYVPANYLNTYKMHDFWGMYDVRPIGAATTETTSVQVTPSETTATVAWPTVNGAETYEMVIKDKQGNVICTLIFNSNGQLTEIAFNAPSRNGAVEQTQATGFSFTVTGLEEGTAYELTLTSKDSNGTTLDKKTIAFNTTGGTGVADILSDNTPTTKVLHDGKVFILRGDKAYTVQGQEVIT